VRIAQIMLAKGFGGAERSFVDLCAELLMRGHQVLAVCEARGAALPMLRALPGLDIVTVRVWGAWDPLARVAISRALRARRVEVVQCHLARAAHLGGAAARRLGLPTLAKTHNYVDLKYYRSIDCLVPTTRAQDVYLVEHGIPPDRVHRIPNFSRLPATPAAGHALATPARVLALGRLVEKKGFDVLLDALDLLAARRPAAALEVVIAGDGPLRAALEARARRLPVTIAVRFVGWVDAVAPLFATADLFVLPSRDEPFGIVVLEAMASGVPIVATRTAGPLEVLDADTAQLIPIGDATALAQAIADFLTDPSAARRRADGAAQAYRERYSADAVVPQYERLYTTLARAAGGRTSHARLR
jgi:glycosyltransferase involved in cell wall biosynthesis